MKFVTTFLKLMFWNECKYDEKYTYRPIITK